MTRILILACLLLGLALSGTGYLLKREYGKTAVLEASAREAAKARKRDDATLARRAAANAASARREALLRRSLDDALTRNREWADQPVPQEVQDALTP